MAVVNRSRVFPCGGRDDGEALGVTDIGGYSDASFGLLWLMGYQFSPRLANFGELRFYRIDRKADYGELGRIAKHRVNLEKIRRL